MKRLLTICTTLCLMMIASPAFCSKGKRMRALDGFFHHYFVQPFSELIIWLANFFHDDYGLSIMFVTFDRPSADFPLLRTNLKAKSDAGENGTVEASN
ncbi:hypothetical protein ACEQPO_18405 [Bacillus sp. SL00103]